jgi:TRAP-type C4-dicarboxylate transport system permease small subunit
MGGCVSPLFKIRRPLVVKASQTIMSVINKTSFVLAAMATISVFFMGVITTIDVVCRYFLSVSLPGSQEMVEMALPVAVFGSLAFAVHRGALVSIEAVTNLLPVRLKNVVSLIVNCLCLVTMVLLTWGTSLRTEHYITHPNLTTAVIHIPYLPFYIITSFCCFVVAIEYACRVINNIRTIKVGGLV